MTSQPYFLRNKTIFLPRICGEPHTEKKYQNPAERFNRRGKITPDLSLGRKKEKSNAILVLSLQTNLMCGPNQKYRDYQKLSQFPQAEAAFVAAALLALAG